MSDWRVTQVRLSAEAREALDRLCDEHRITLTALIEAIGLAVAEGTLQTPPELIQRAGMIDRERRSR